MNVFVIHVSGPVGNTDDRESRKATQIKMTYFGRLRKHILSFNVSQFDNGM